MDAPSRPVAVLGLLAAVTVGAALWWSSGAPGPLPDPVVPEANPLAAGITVHVSGAVRSPGLVEVASGARIADAVAAAGGARSDADLGALNLAAPVVDGGRVVVPALLPDAPAGSAPGRVPLNAASAEQLQRIPGVGPVLAERIVAHRSAHGPFTVVEDLLDVPGIGEGKLAAMRDAVAVP
ncbi:MAG: ComEA family DNA-binding protein [Acidimicrobiia bacterium]|nr:ComEA family DNA-binding protein [Acidimicrobiia bacterium]